MEKVRIQDDLYHYVNDEKLAELVIPDDRPTAGGFSELNESVELLLREDFRKFASGEKAIPLKEMEDAVRLYKKYLDADRRNKEGIAPLLPNLERIIALKDVNDLNANAYELAFSMRMPIQYGVGTDMKDATRHCFEILGPSIILPDTTYYQEGNQAGPALLGVFSQMLGALLALTPLSQEEQAKVIQDTLAFDALVAKVVKSQVEWADYASTYNPQSLEEVAEQLKPFDFMKLLKDIYGDKLPDKIIVDDPKAIKEFHTYFNEENFVLFKHWAYAHALIRGASYLSEDMHSMSTIFRRTMYGIQKDPVLEKQAYQIVSAIFREPIGVYYGRTYFGEEAKQDVIKMVKSIIEMYKVRMKENTFLAEATKEKAILKLSTMEIKMGYPDKVDEFYSLLKVNDEDSLLEAMAKIAKISEIDNLNDLHKPVDRTKWGMPGHMVNASYNPTMNDITFPAAILQPPFYSIKQSISQNLGGIGAVIGHEISHAFDNNGAKLDEKGNINNWWTKEDYEHFQELTKRMIDQWDGIEFYGGRVNGELIVSENIADNGGMGVTIAIMKTLKEKDYQEYFKNWARVWCLKAQPQYIQLLLTNDVHAPAELRANMQPRNFAEWYTAFDVKDSDKMFIPEDKRITIW